MRPAAMEKAERAWRITWAYCRWVGMGGLLAGRRCVLVTRCCARSTCRNPRQRGGNRDGSDQDQCWFLEPIHSGDNGTLTGVPPAPTFEMSIDISKVVPMAVSRRVQVI